MASPMSVMDKSVHSTTHFLRNRKSHEDHYQFETRWYSHISRASSIVIIANNSHAELLYDDGETRLTIPVCGVRTVTVEQARTIWNTLTSHEEYFYHSKKTVDPKSGFDDWVIFGKMMNDLPQYA